MKRGNHKYLSDADVLAIAELLRTTDRTTADIGDDFNASSQSVTRILKGGHSAHPTPVVREAGAKPPKGHKLTPDTARQAAAWLAEGVTKHVVAKRLGVSHDTIKSLSIGKTWSKATGIVQGPCW